MRITQSLIKFTLLPSVPVSDVGAATLYVDTDGFPYISINGGAYVQISLGGAASEPWLDDGFGNVRLVALANAVAVGQAAADPGYELSVAGAVDVLGNVDAVGLSSHRVLNALGDAEPAARLGGDILGFGPGGAGPQDCLIRRMGASLLEVNVGGGGPELTITPGFVGVDAAASTLGSSMRVSLTDVGNGGVRAALECDLTITADGAGAGTLLAFGSTLTIGGDAAPVVVLGHNTFISYGSTGAVAAFVAGYQVNINIDAPAGVAIGAIPLLVGSTVSGFYGAQLSSSVLEFQSFGAQRLPTDAANTVGRQIGFSCPNLGGVAGTTDAIAFRSDPQSGATGRNLSGLFQSPLVLGAGLVVDVLGGEQFRNAGGSLLEGSTVIASAVGATLGVVGDAAFSGAQTTAGRHGMAGAQVRGGTNVTVAMSPYTILTTDYLLRFRSIGAAIAATLPKIGVLPGQAPDGFELELADFAGTALAFNDVITAAAGDTINGLALYTIATAYGGLKLIADLATLNWHIQYTKV